MFHKTLLVVSLLLLFSSTGTSQIRRDTESSMRERALRIEPFIRESSKRYGIDAQLLRILCFIESRYRLDAVSPKGARGPMQFMPDTATRFGIRNPHDPQQAIDAAARYLRELLRKFGGRLDLALAAYNSGEGTVESFRTGRPLVLPTGRIINRRGQITGGIPPYRETQEYVKSAITFFNESRVKTASVSLQMSHASPWSNWRNPISSQRPTRVASNSATQKTSSLFIEVQ